MTLCSACLVAARVPSALPALPETWKGNSFDGSSDSTEPDRIYSYRVPEEGYASADLFGVAHHNTLDELAECARHCSLCELILKRRDVLLSTFQELEEDDLSRYYRLQRQRHKLPERWNLRLARRPDGGDGFVVLVPGGGDQRILYLFAAFGFCSEPGKSTFANMGVKKSADRPPFLGEQIRLLLRTFREGEWTLTVDLEKHLI
jgi:hypothetical protein